MFINPSAQIATLSRDLLTKLVAGLFAVFPQSAGGDEHSFRAEHRLDVGWADGLAEEEALGELAPEAARLGALGRGLEAFGDDPEPEVLGQVDECA